LHCIALHCIALHCIALHCIALHCIALHIVAAGPSCHQLEVNRCLYNMLPHRSCLVSEPLALAMPCHTMDYVTYGFNKVYHR
jgi:hypothetical protein